MPHLSYGASTGYYLSFIVENDPHTVKILERVMREIIFNEDMVNEYFNNKIQNCKTESEFNRLIYLVSNFEGDGFEIQL